MKKALSLILVFIVAFTICGCKKSKKDMLSDINKIIEKSTVAKGLGIIFDDDINNKEITKIERAKVYPDGIKTLCYETLTDNQKSAYEYMLTACNDMPSGWFFCGKTSELSNADISVAYRAVLSDNPQIFWMPLTYIMATNKGKIYIAFQINEDDIINDYLLPKSKRDNMSKALFNAASVVVNAANTYATDFEKEVYVHDYLCSFANYDLNGGDMIYSSYGALVNGVCVCEGYSRAMQLIMQSLGIKCALIYGKYDGEGHMWNYINIGNEWYHTDLTWGRNEDFGVLHCYFNLTDSEIKQNHQIIDIFNENSDVDSGNYNILEYACTSNQFNYYNALGLTLSNDIQSNASTVLNSYKAEKNYVEFKNLIEGDEKEILNQTAALLYPNIALKSYTKFSKIILLFFENTY